MFSYASFFIEASAAPMALGALDTRKETFELMCMLNPDLLDAEATNRIICAFKPMTQRKVRDTLAELNEDDRRTFDEVVMNAFGLSNYLSEITDSLKSLLEARLA